MLKVYVYPDPVLICKAKPVQTINRHLRRLVDEMFETMYEERGVRLAAPQVGKGIRLCVINCTGDEADALVLINPQIIEASEEQVTDEEGCLSVPGIRSNVTRPERVKVRAYDVDGNKLELDADGLQARCLQHEIDHLNGRLFFQRLGSAARMLIGRRIKRLEEEFKDA